MIDISHGLSLSNTPTPNNFFMHFPKISQTWTADPNFSIARFHLVPIRNLLVFLVYIRPFGSPTNIESPSLPSWCLNQRWSSKVHSSCNGHSSHTITQLVISLKQIAGEKSRELKGIGMVSIFCRSSRFQSFLESGTPSKKTPSWKIWGRDFYFNLFATFNQVRKSGCPESPTWMTLRWCQNKGFQWLQCIAGWRTRSCQWQHWQFARSHGSSLFV